MAEELPPPPEPSFVHFGLDGGASCMGLVTIAAEREGARPVLAVGTTKGQVILFTTNTHERLYVIYVDPEKRKIVAVGQLSDGLIWVHVRHSAVHFIKIDCRRYEDEPLLSFEELHEVAVPTAHYGFCGVCVFRDSILIPDMEEEVTTFKQPTGEVWARSKAKGLPHFAAELRLEVAGQEEPLSFLAVACEDGSLEIHGDDGLLVTESLYKEPIFALATGKEGRVVVGSAKPPLNLLHFDLDEEKKLKLASTKPIEYRPDAKGISSLCFTSTGKQVIAGFWTGTVRVFSIKTLKPLLVLNFHEDSISQVLWISEEKEDPEEEPEKMIVAASMDSKLTLWKL